VFWGVVRRLWVVMMMMMMGVSGRMFERRLAVS
jgi:hypothetical protein